MTHESEGDWGETQLDRAEQAEADINLDEPSSTADEPWSPPERQPRGAEFIDGDEAISQRLRQEEPDPDAGYHDPDDVEMVGGDDPDAVPAEDDVIGGDARDGGELLDLGSEEGPEAGALHVDS
jgi:hypothetical protein